MGSTAVRVSCSWPGRHPGKYSSGFIIDRLLQGEAKSREKVLIVADQRSPELHFLLGRVNRSWSSRALGSWRNRG
jgi:hypothetical protein